MNFQKMFFFCCLSLVSFSTFSILSNNYREERKKVRRIIGHVRTQARMAHKEFDEFLTAPVAILVNTRNRYNHIDIIKESFLIHMHYSLFDKDTYVKHLDRFNMFHHQIRQNIQAIEQYRAVVNN